MAVKVKRLSQLLAVELPLKQRVNTATGLLHKTAQKADLFDGHSKVYQPLVDQGENLPPDHKKVQARTGEVIQSAAEQIAELIDVVFTKDHANTLAKSTVTVDGVDLFTDAPTTFLMFLVKQFDDLKSIIEALPVLDPAEHWELDKESNLYKTEPILTARQIKVNEPIVLYPATEKHPAQTQMATVDKLAGHWERIRHSGAIPEPKKKELLRRVEKVRNAVKESIEDANTIKVDERKAGEAIFKYILKP